MPAVHKLEVRSFRPNLLKSSFKDDNGRIMVLSVMIATRGAIETSLTEILGHYGSATGLYLTGASRINMNE